ncbi:MAG: NAD(P)/FAD-dependent oxidoreductase [Desulfobacteraceae bacterium]|nr:NAD(P)/FAD-dependent oxidoreductase [Desulfobacteraceae bacterium]
MKRYVIVGNGVAGTTAAENIRKLDQEGTITILTNEDLPFYYRIRLNEYLSGNLKEEELLAKKAVWYKDLEIDLKLQSPIVGGDPQEKVLFDEDKGGFFYDTLLIATGSHSFIPPITGSEKKGAFAIRSIQDCRGISGWAKKAEEVVLIGGGLLGLEAGNALLKLGLKVTVVEFFPRLLPRQLDDDGAKRLQTIMEGMGFSFRLGAKTQEITGDNEVTGVSLEGGESLNAQMVVISAGVRPNMELARPLGLETDKGIKIDEYLRTNQPDIYSAGDVAEFKGMPYGIWPAAMEQGKIAGTNMAGGSLVYEGTIMANTLKVVGVDLASAGEIDADGKFDAKVVTDEKTYKKIVIDNNLIIGCIMLGDKKGFNKITRMMSEKRSLTEIGDDLKAEGFDPGA